MRWTKKFEYFTSVYFILNLLNKKRELIFLRDFFHMNTKLASLTRM